MGGCASSATRDGGAPRLRGGVLVAVAVAPAPALPARATYGARTTADEPQYLLSALSLWEDRDLDIADELADRALARLPRGRSCPCRPSRSTTAAEVSPHDPLLPVLLAVPVGLGGWAGAKAALAVLAGVLAAAARVDARTAASPCRCGRRRSWSARSRSAPPLAAYGDAGLPRAARRPRGDRRRRRRSPVRSAGAAWLLGAAVVALPWLAVKYAPGRRRPRRRRAWCAWRGAATPAPAAAWPAALAAAGVVYARRPPAVYGGLDPYAAGDHFVGGEHTVVGHRPRLRRPAAGACSACSSTATSACRLARRRGCSPSPPSPRSPAGGPPWWPALVLPLAAGWLTATFVALTMHGWWWPGRQTVVVLPFAVLAVAWWAGRRRRSRRRAARRGRACGAVAV